MVVSFSKPEANRTRFLPQVVKTMPSIAFRLSIPIQQKSSNDCDIRQSRSSTEFDSLNQRRIKTQNHLKVFCAIFTDPTSYIKNR